jgi:hypothetical protein
MFVGMEGAVKEYLSAIGRRGGVVSRRRLSAEDARSMVKIREARRAYAKFHAQCFWSYDPHLKITSPDVAWVAAQLMKQGGREAWNAGSKLCR